MLMSKHSGNWRFVPAFLSGQVSGLRVSHIPAIAPQVLEHDIIHL